MNNTKILFEKTRDALAAFLESAPVIKNHFDERGIDCDDFAKKLLGQIVFLYFLQKKGWFGVERGKTGAPVAGISFATCSQTAPNTRTFPAARRQPNFFNDILEPLFYEASLRRGRMMTITIRDSIATSRS